MQPQMDADGNVLARDVAFQSAFICGFLSVCAAAVENMLLAITALGLGAVWVDGWLRVEGRAERIGELLGIPSGKVVRVILPVGVPAKQGRRAQKLPFSERAWFNRYGE